MATFQDLTPYTYSPTECPTLNIGWIGRDADFTRGLVSEVFSRKLLALATRPVNVMRGVHHCELCGIESPIIVIDPGLPGRRAILGTGEVRVLREDGILLAAPTLVVHYIDAHGYKPPQDFIDAVIATDKNGPISVR
jgi:hypothetical protein